MEPPAELLSRRQATLLMLLLAFPVELFLRTAWITEDAFISFRTIGNLFHGYDRLLVTPLDGDRQ